MTDERSPTAEAVREATENAAGAFSVLAEWDAQEQNHATRPASVDERGFTPVEGKSLLAFEVLET